MAERQRQCAECDKPLTEHRATLDAPYHFTDSGLPDVELVGISYFTCECGHVSARIPEIENLMNLIARDVAEKPAFLSGDEIRFLRKRLGEKSTVFAQAVAVKPESLSRIENGHVPAGIRVDRLVRYHYALVSQDPVLRDKLRTALLGIVASKRKATSAKVIATISSDNQWEAELCA